LHGSLGGLGGLAAVESPGIRLRHGFAGQLYETRGLTAAAEPARVDEGNPVQLAAVAVLDDATLLPLPPTSVAWSVVGGSISGISREGLATTTNVYEDTEATVRSDHQAASALVALEILNTGDDDFGLYAGDGLNDAWQVRYFGVENPLAKPAEDPDEDHVSNSLEFVADTHPDDPASFFAITRIHWLEGFTVWFESSADRVYTLYRTDDPASGDWTAIPSQTDVPGTGGERHLTDVTPTSSQAFHRVEVRIP
jgi:hypothetical protein